MHNDIPKLYPKTPPGYSQIETVKIGQYAWRLTKDFITPFGTVPAGFAFNGASVPRLGWTYIDPAGEAFEASCIHDYLYQTTLKTKEYADNAFKETLIAFGVRETKAKLAHKLVSAFGKGNYT